MNDCIIHFNDSLDLAGTKSIYLKCIYDTKENPDINPITDINFFSIKNYKNNKKILIVPETDIILPIPISTYPNTASPEIIKAKTKESKKAIIYKEEYDLVKLLNNEGNPNTSLVLI